MGLHNAFTELAEKKMKDAQVKGHALGHAEGHKLGYAEGQIDERRNIAYNAFSMGFSFEQVTQLCKGNPAEVETWFEKWCIENTAARE